MDCKYINQKDIHEKYLLDRLNKEEKFEYLSHLNQCKSCMSDLEAEKELIGSVRHIGKSEIKSEIVKQVAKIKSRKKDVSWDMILKVAAIFFFLVITPALVFYYQTIETPKISETIDFDETLNLQKEIESAKPVEKVEEKKTEIVKSKRKKEESVSDIIEPEGYMKSAGRAEVEPTLRSVRIAKPSTESDELEEELVNDILSDEEVPIESEQPLPAAPKSIIPELEKFIKPKFTSVKDHEYFRTKISSSKKMTATSHSQIYDKTQSVKESASAGKGRSEQLFQDKLSKNEIYKLDYKINNKIVVINLVPLFEESEFYFQEVFPDSFPVIKKKINSVDLTMDWFINSHLRNINPNDISLYFQEDNLLNVNILNEKFYQIDLNSDSTKAKIIQ